MARSTTKLRIYIFVLSSLSCFQFVLSSGCSCRSTISTEDVIPNHVLLGHVISVTKVPDVGQCFHLCIHDNRCRSFNIGQEKVGWLCELSESNKALSPLQEIQGKDYYEIRTRLFPEPSHFKDCSCSHYIDSTCECIDGYVGRYCHIKAYSCQDHLRYKSRALQSGLYFIFDDAGTSYPVYCDIDVGSMSAWTLVLSYALKHNSFFKFSPFYLDQTSNQNSPNWQMYRLSLSRMKSIRGSSQHWRATCNYNSFGIDKRDYAVAKWTDIDLLTLEGGGCLRFVYIDVRGSHCSNCTTWVHQGLKYSRMFLVSAPFGESKGCDLTAVPHSDLYEESFGYYHKTSSDFRCTANSESTTEFWFGGAI